MKNIFKALAIMLAAIMIITAFGTLVLAENEESTESSSEAESPSAEETSQPSGDETSEASGDETSDVSGDETSDVSGDETSDVSGDETSDVSGDETSNMPEPDYTVTFEGVGVTVLCNDKEIKDVYYGYLSESSRATITVRLDPKYHIEDPYDDIDCGNVIFAKTAENIYQGTFKPKAGEQYHIKVNAQRIPQPVSLSVSATAKGVNGYSVTVNGLSYDPATMKIIEGDAVSVTFDLAEDFDADKSELIVNGRPEQLYENVYSFTMNEDTAIVLKSATVKITVRIEGSGSVTAGKYGTYSGVAGVSEKVFEISKDDRVAFQLNPSADWKIQSVNITESDHAGSNGLFYVVAHGDSLFHVIFKKEDAPVSTTATVRLNVGMGGSVEAGGKKVIGGTGTSFELEKGAQLDFKVTADEGFELDVFRVSGNSVPVSGGSYTLTNIQENVTVSVSFKSNKPIVDDGAIGVEDINWNGGDIIVDVRGNKLVKREVLDKIAELDASTGKYVAFVGDETTLYVPYGGKSEGSGTLADLSGRELTSGDLKDRIEQAIKDKTDQDIVHKIYTFNVGFSLPVGTQAQFNLGEQFADYGAVMLLFDAEENKFYTKPEAPYSVYVDEKGVSGQYAYDNEGLVMLSKNIPGEYTIEATALNVGGSINPSGITSATLKSSASFLVTANPGYVISRIFVDDVELENVAGLSTYTHTFENISNDHTIKAEFAISGTISQDEDDTDGNRSLVVVLIIVLVALLGAAALFFVKWKQEKF